MRGVTSHVGISRVKSKIHSFNKSKSFLTLTNIVLWPFNSSNAPAVTQSLKVILQKKKKVQ